jgi:hypothetical protein
VSREVLPQISGMVQAVDESTLCGSTSTHHDRMADRL